MSKNCLKQRQQKLLDRLDEIDGPAPGIEARVDTIQRIRKGKLPFGGVEGYLEVHSRNSESSKHDIDKGMSAARVDEIERYLDTDSEREVTR